MRVLDLEEEIKYMRKEIQEAKEKLKTEQNQKERERIMYTMGLWSGMLAVAKTLHSPKSDGESSP